jgi:hypothetical protein
MAINLNDYEDVASLNKWFQGNFPMGSLRIIKQEHHIMTDKDGHIIDEIFVVQTAAFRDVNDAQMWLGVGKANIQNTWQDFLPKMLRPVVMEGQLHY